MDTLHREGFIGTQITLTLPMRNLDGTEFVPRDNYALIFTAKNNENDEDADAVIQLTTGAGIVHDYDNAICTIQRAATIDLTARVLIFDIMARHVVTGEVIHTVSYGRLQLHRSITRETSTSIPVVTTEDPLPFGPVVSVTAGDDLEVIHNGITYYVPLYRRA